MTAKTGDNLNTVEKDFPLHSVYEVISFYLRNNPARAKSVNLLEPERGNSADREESEGLWAEVCKAIARTSEDHQRYDDEKNEYVPSERWIAFSARYLAPRENDTSFENIARLMGRHDETIKKWCGQVRRDLEDTCRRMGILPPPDPR